MLRSLHIVLNESSSFSRRLSFLQQAMQGEAVEESVQGLLTAEKKVFSHLAQVVGHMESRER
jgi:hypothetical protein